MREMITETKYRTQSMRILAHLESGESITQLEALRLYGSMRLAGHIHNLRRRGYDIKSESVNIDGSYVSRYRLR